MTTTSLRDAQPEDALALCAAEQAIVRAHDGLLVSEPDELHEAAFLERIASVSGGRGKYLVVERESALLSTASRIAAWSQQFADSCRAPSNA